MNYKVVYSNRKTVAIHILPGGIVEVRAPFNLNKSFISELVDKKQGWIEQNLRKLKEREENRKTSFLDFGSNVLVLGKDCPVLPVSGNKAYFDGESFFIPENAEKGDIKTLICALMKKIAKSYLTDKTILLSKKMGCKITNVSVNSAKTRWGSCSGKNSINFSWRLIAADEKCIEYVIIHELCHTKEHNHSAKFWAEVEKYEPFYKKYKENLKKTEEKLTKLNI